VDILDSKSDQELVQSLLAEIAKAHNELKCARADIEKAQSRMKFVIMLSNKLIERQGD
jgi:predicted small metal-binding protein